MDQKKKKYRMLLMQLSCAVLLASDAAAWAFRGSPGSLERGIVYCPCSNFYPMRRKTPCFSYGDIRRVHRIYASN